MATIAMTTAGSAAHGAVQGFFDGVFGKGGMGLRERIFGISAVERAGIDVNHRAVTIVKNTATGLTSILDARSKEVVANFDPRNLASPFELVVGAAGNAMNDFRDILRENCERVHEHVVSVGNKTSIWGDVLVACAVDLETRTVYEILEFTADLRSGIDLLKFLVAHTVNDLRLLIYLVILFLMIAIVFILLQLFSDTWISNVTRSLFVFLYATLIAGFVYFLYLSSHSQRFTNPVTTPNARETRRLTEAPQQPPRRTLTIEEVPSESPQRPLARIESSGSASSSSSSSSSSNQGIPRSGSPSLLGKIRDRSRKPSGSPVLARGGSSPHLLVLGNSQSTEPLTHTY